MLVGRLSFYLELEVEVYFCKMDLHLFDKLVNALSDKLVYAKMKKYTAVCQDENYELTTKLLIKKLILFSFMYQVKLYY